VLEIQVATATAEGSTELAAFDNALLKCGVGNYNLLYLSSVIPRGSRVVRCDSASPGGNWGDRLYCVIAQHRTSLRGHETWAGMSWVQDAVTGHGLFAEAHGSSEAEVCFSLTTTLNEMTASRPEVSWGDQDLVVAGLACDGSPVCAVAVAVYTTQCWIP
jgi:arginine decarboxylase